MNINKKVIVGAAIFLVFFVVTSIVYLLVSISNQGNSKIVDDYIPPNSVNITNVSIIYDYVDNDTANQITSMIKTAVLYDISVSNDPNASTEYTNFDSFDPSAAEYLKKDTTYKATIDNGKVNSVDDTPWNYTFTLTTNDKRHFTVYANVDPDNTDKIISIQKLVKV